jgi:uncharacterized protein YggT (Ycf19 family)
MYIIDLILNFYLVGLCIYSILLWLNLFPEIKLFLAKFYEPFLRPIRTKLNSTTIDLSPMILSVIILIVIDIL